MEVVDEEKRLAKVDVAGVRRNVNIGLLDADEGGGVGPGDWVLIHVGFAISQVDEEEARATRDLLERMGAFGVHFAEPVHIQHEVGAKRAIYHQFSTPMAVLVLLSEQIFLRTRDRVRNSRFDLRMLLRLPLNTASQ